MAKFASWCGTADEVVKKHSLRTLQANITKVTLGMAAVAKLVPGHYASEERIASLFSRLGKKKTAKYISGKLPSSKNIRSGDLGEILAANYVAEFTKYTNAINRLRWKDHRNMAMRGDDIIAVRKVPAPKKIEFLKGEVKSSVSLTAAIVAKARKALKKDSNRPSPHALSFLADRLHEEGETDLANLIDDAQLLSGIKLSQVSHLLFTFSGNDATKLLRDDLNAYNGSVTQYAVALIVKGVHQAFIKGVYDKVIADGSNG